MEGRNQLCWSQKLAHGAPFWRAEIKRGLHWHRGDPEPFLFICHGGDDATGEWCAWPDKRVNGGLTIPMSWVATGLAGTHPGRPIFLLSCNRNALLSCNRNAHCLGVPGVYYARRVILSVPYLDVTGRFADQFEELGTDEHPAPTAPPRPPMLPVPLLPPPFPPLLLPPPH